MNSDTILSARRMIGDLTPLKSDCGTRCASACCKPDADGQGGVYLFPGEEMLMQDFGKIVRDDFAPIMICEGACDRAQRPLGCRIFPLTPFQREDGTWSVRMDARARAMCPLTKRGVRGLNREFVNAVRAAIRAIAQDPQGEAYLKRWQDLESAYRFEL